MSDIGPNQEIIKERVRLQIKEFEVNMQKQYVHLLELKEEIRKIEDNRSATETAIKNLRAQIGE